MNVISHQLATLGKLTTPAWLYTVVEVRLPRRQLQLESANPAVQFAQQPVVVSHSMHPELQSSTGTVVTEMGRVTACVAIR